MNAKILFVTVLLAAVLACVALAQQDQSSVPTQTTGQATTPNPNCPVQRTKAMLQQLMNSLGGANSPMAQRMQKMAEQMQASGE